MKVVSLFTGAGGMDVGFENAGFNIIWANEFDKDMWATYEHAHPTTILDKRDITKIPSNQIPDMDGLIGGPPCQSWSAAGKNLGANDLRGQAFFEYIRIVNDKLPKFFVIENVEGITRKTHADAFATIINDLEHCGTGYRVHHDVLVASDFQVPQDRMRLFIVGFRKDLLPSLSAFTFPNPSGVKVVLKDAISDLVGRAKPTKSSVVSDPDYYFDSGWSSNFMSRNRVRSWDEFAFTVPASARHVTIHPQAPKMVYVSRDKFKFVEDYEHLYRRFTINEVARLQTFPDDYFKFHNINAAHKMIGNAVPCKLAEAVAQAVISCFTPKKKISIKVVKK